MFRLFLTPEWFARLDIAFSVIGIVVALLVAGYSFRMYRINKENKYAYFSFAFILVSFSFFSQIMTNSILNFTPVRDVAADVLRPLAGERLSLSSIFYRLGFFAQMVSMLAAWLLIFFISQKPRQRLRKYYEVSQIALFIYLVLLVSVVSNFKYFVFYLTSAVLLGLITLNYYKNYLNTNKNARAFNVMLSFLFILAGNVALVFVFLSQMLYVIGEGLILIGFLQLLYTYYSVTRK